jgi:hypothetical protein
MRFPGKNRAAFCIFDKNIKKHIESVGFDLFHEVFPVTKISDLDALIQNAFKASYKDVSVQTPWRNWPQKSGVDPDGMDSVIKSWIPLITKNIN